MRLQKRILDKLETALHHSFGDVNVYLFGSRVDDTKKGGDIDIAIQSDISREEFRKNKIKFLRYLLSDGFDFPIDVVNYNTKDELLKNQIMTTGQKLF